MKLELRQYDHSDPDQRVLLEKFCSECGALGIENNNSIDKLKLEEFRSRPIQYWAALDSESWRIAGVAGCHRLEELGDGYFRVLFRGCMLPEYRGRGLEGLSKSHRNSYLFRFATPLQIDWAKRRGGRHFVITTNVEVQGGAASTDRLFHSLERQNIVRKIHSNEELFGVRQNIWELVI